MGIINYFYQNTQTLKTRHMNKFAVLAALFASTNAVSDHCDNACLSRLLHSALRRHKATVEQPAAQEPEAPAEEPAAESTAEPAEQKEEEGNQTSSETQEGTAQSSDPMTDAAVVAAE